MPSNSWQAYLCAMNETDTAKKNFNTFIDAMAIENSKIEKINAITEDPDSIKLVVKQKRSSSSTAARYLAASAPIQP